MGCPSTISPHTHRGTLIATALPYVPNCLKHAKPTTPLAAIFSGKKCLPACMCGLHTRAAGAAKISPMRRVFFHVAGCTTVLRWDPCPNEMHGGANITTKDLGAINQFKTHLWCDGLQRSKCVTKSHFYRNATSSGHRIPQLRHYRQKLSTTSKSPANSGRSK